MNLQDDRIVSIPSSIQGKAPNFKTIDKNISVGYKDDKLSSIANKFGDTLETDEIRIANRMKQVEFGKNTKGYDNYIAAVPK